MVKQAMVNNIERSGPILLLVGLVLGWFAHGLWQGVGQEGVNDRLLVDEPRLERNQGIDSVSTPVLSESVVIDSITNNELKFQQQMLVLLRAKQFDDAIAYFEQVEATQSESQVVVLKEFILDYARSLLNKQQVDVALALLSAYSNLYYRDTEALLLKSQAQFASNRALSGVRTLYDSKAQAVSVDQQQSVERRLRRIVRQYINQLTSVDDFTGLLVLYQLLTELEPSYGFYYLQLAKTQIKLNELDGALKSLEFITFDPEFSKEANALTQEINSKRELIADYDILVPLDRAGDQYIVQANVEDQGTLNLLIDTGASLTIVKPSKLLSLGLADITIVDTKLLNTANGQVESGIARLQSFAVGSMKLTSMNVGLVELEGLDRVDGLLGMDFLRQYRFFIDQDQATLYLAPK